MASFDHERGNYGDGLREEEEEEGIGTQDQLLVGSDSGSEDNSN